MTPAEDLVCAIIRGDVGSYPLFDESRLDQLVEAAFHHNVHLIVFDILRKSSGWGHWPRRLREKLHNVAAQASILDLFDEQELRKVLIGLNDSGIRPLLLKGVPIAYTLYQSPTLRQRGDTDLLIREIDLAPVARILREFGYDGPNIQAEKPASYEGLYSRKTLFGTEHYLDVHWKINNAQLFAKTFTFDELFAEAIEIPSLASCARGLSHTHALLLACMHLFAHAHAPFYVNGNPIYAGDHLRWVYDIHLLCSALDSGRWSEFATLARTKSIAEFCVDGLNRAREAFNSQIPADTMNALQTAARDEPASAQKLRGSAVTWFFANLRALPNLRQRIALIKQVTLPPPGSMIRKYQTNNPFALPFLYGYRAINGVFKALKRSNLQR
jgi:Uncharacterised nucleotidyltransferase